MNPSQEYMKTSKYFHVVHDGVHGFIVGVHRFIDGVHGNFEGYQNYREVHQHNVDILPYNIEECHDVERRYFVIMRYVFIFLKAFHQTKTGIITIMNRCCVTKRYVMYNKKYFTETQPYFNRIGNPVNTMLMRGEITKRYGDRTKRYGEETKKYGEMALNPGNKVFRSRLEPFPHGF